MSSSQKRAIRNYRSRLRKRGSPDSRCLARLVIAS
jgi:hypothetical protein